MRILAQFSLVALGHAFVRLEEYLLDYVLYPYMLFDGGGRLLRLTGWEPISRQEGFWAGFAFMLLLSVAINVAYIVGYDRVKRDWFGIEAIRSVQPTWMKRLPNSARAIAKGVTFIGLSMWANPVFAVLWSRSDTSAFAMERRDWVLFALAIVLANVGWAGVMVLAAIAIKSFYMVI